MRTRVCEERTRRAHGKLVRSVYDVRKDRARRLRRRFFISNAFRNRKIKMNGKKEKKKKRKKNPLRFSLVFVMLLYRRIIIVNRVLT